MNFNPLKIINVFLPEPKDPATLAPLSSFEQLKRHPQYKAQTRLFSYLIYLLMFLIVALLVLFKRIHDPIEPKLYEVTVAQIKKNDLKNKRLLLFNKPRHTKEIIEQWASIALADIYTFDFLNANERFNHAKQYFTKGGFDRFADALTEGKLEKMTTEKLSVSTMLFGNILFYHNFGTQKKLADDNNLYYHFQAPMRLTKQRGNRIEEFDIMFEVELAVLVDKGKTGFFINNLNMGKAIPVVHF